MGELVQLIKISKRGVMNVELTQDQIKAYTRRLLLARMHILATQGFYGLLLMHMKFTLDEQVGTAATDGTRMYFAPSFMDQVSDPELEFIMMHEILHVALQHCFRRGGRDPEVFNIACDIVVNSNILKSCDMDKQAITLAAYGESMHLTPRNEEGFRYTAEQVYEMLLPPGNWRKQSGQNASGDAQSTANSASGQNSGSNAGAQSSSSNASGKDPGNSGRKRGSGRRKGAAGKDAALQTGQWDDHSRWRDEDGDMGSRIVWTKRVIDASEAVQIRDPSNSRGLLPAFAKRILEELKEPQIDWRSILNDFVQEEITDYSFTPPDRRFADGDFFLPDYNEKEQYPRDILFMVDTSASMSDGMITAAYSEIKGAIDQYDGRLEGWLGFFDAEVSEPVSFREVHELLSIRPVGGGGTDFSSVFQWVRQNLGKIELACIIILTDGFAPFPPKSQAMEIPVLWLLNNDRVKPPWGKVARIKLEK